MSGWSGLATKLKESSAIARATADAEFLEKYNCSCSQHITNAAVATVTPAQVEKNRSKDGQAWMKSPPMPRHRTPSIQAYHALEEQAKVAVGEGKIPVAIQLLEDANRVQTAYEIANFGGVADSAHAASKTFRLARQSSLGKIEQALIVVDPGVVTAKLNVSQYYAQRGLLPP